MVSVNVESREYNGRWYTDVREWRIQPKSAEPAAAPAPSDYPPMPDTPPAEGVSYKASAEEVDDLPF